MKHIKKFNESIVDYDAYDIIIMSETFKKLIMGNYKYDYDFIDDLEIELTELDFGDTDVVRAAELVFIENEKDENEDEDEDDEDYEDEDYE